MAVEIKRIVCLANSWKGGGRCIAGKEVLRGGQLGRWIRPVSARESAEVSIRERQYGDGRDPMVLDIIDIPVLKAQPKDYQRENWLLDPDSSWVKVLRLAPGELEPFIDPVAPLWIDGHSSSNGQDDRIPISDTVYLRDSLRLIKVNALELSVDYDNNNRPRVRGQFRYAGRSYSLRVTDPTYTAQSLQEQYPQMTFGSYQIGRKIATISLGEPYYGHSYKLIAAII